MLKSFYIQRIQSKIFFLILIIIIPIILALSFFYYKELELHKSEELRANIEMARAVGEIFDTFVDDIKHGELIIGLIFTESQSMKAQEKNRILVRFEDDNFPVRAVSFINPEGFIVASSHEAFLEDNVSDYSFFKEIINGKYWAISELIEDKTIGKFIFVISRGIRDEQGKLLGIVASVIDPEYLNDVFAVARKKEAGISLIDNKGMHVFRSPHTNYTLDQRNWLKHYPQMEPALKGREVTTSVISQFNGKKRLVAFVPIFSIGWVIAASRAEDEITGPINSMLKFQVSLLFIVILISIGIAVALSRSISKPIIELRNHIIAFGQGEKETLAAISGPDEVKDLTLAMNQMAEKVKLREKQMKEANETLESFSYSVSHDLKTPLRAITGYSRMLMKKHRGKLNEDAVRMLSVINNNTEKMNILIDDLLSFSRTISKTMNIMKLDMKEIANEALNDINETIKERDIEIKITELLPGYGDKTLIKQVFSNIISNAVKFTKNKKPGMIEINSYAEKEKNIYYVKDNGVGFDMNYYDKLFGVFQRLHREEEYEGTGVGLSIVQRIIKRHGGDVWAEGEVGKGATFYFTLPLRN